MGTSLQGVQQRESVRCVVPRLNCIQWCEIERYSCVVASLYTRLTDVR